MTIASVDDLLATLARGRDTDDGEHLDLLAHGLQCAHLLREADGDDLELQIAGLLHDLGTLLEPGRPATHATTGGAAVRALLGAGVAALIADHDQAKRYLVATDAAYRGLLSEMSLITLTLQGGEMDASEREDFEARGHFERVITLRRADDAAKIPGRVVPGLDAWREPLRRVAAAR